MSIRFELAVAVLLCGVGCAGEEKPAQAATRTGLHADSASGMLATSHDPYVVGQGGAAALAVTIGKDTIAPPIDVGTCEVGAERPEGAGDAIVWVDGLREGKPLSRERPYQLVSSGCSLSPRIQAVLVGGTVNVYNDDRVLHRLVFLRAGSNDTLQTMPFTNDNEIVASDRLTKKPGFVEVRCAQHPQEKAWIAVFDHPYFAVGGPGETVKLDGLPEGEYQLMTWREGMSAPVATTTKVGTNGLTTVVLK